MSLKIFIVCSTACAILATGCAADKSESSSTEHLEIANGKICVRQDLTRGGAICHISADDAERRNLVNIYDEGRYIQQSYYAGQPLDRTADGQSPSWSPWHWNPIQVGDYARNRAQILASERTDSTIYVKCIPMLWDMDNEPAEAIMEQWTTLRGNTIHVRNRLTCQRTDSIWTEVKARDQEIPAVYPISSLKKLFFYCGDKPFTNDTLSCPPVQQLILDQEPKQFWGSYPVVSEQWMAFVDDNHWGMGVYSPTAGRFLAGRFTDDTNGEAMSEATSYIAPTRTETLSHSSVSEYEYCIIIDSLPAIRSTVYRLAGVI